MPMPLNRSRPCVAAGTLRRRASLRPRAGVEGLECRWLLAATFYVAEAGNDAADGHTPQTAWRSVGRANKQDFEPGDQLLFEGGKTFALPPAGGSPVLTLGANTI